MVHTYILQLDGEEFLDRDPSRGLGRFVIGHLGLSGSILSDDSISINVLLDTVMLDDLRPETVGVKRLVICNHELNILAF